MQQRWSTAVMAAFGVLVGHGLAYAGQAGGGHPRTAVHDLLDNLLFVLSPFAALALLLLVVGEVQKTHRIPAGRLVTIQTVLFLVQEAVERQAAGLAVSGIAADPALWLGLAAQVALAAAALLTVRTAARTLRGRSTTPAAVLRPAGRVTATSVSGPVVGTDERRVARGPPVAPPPPASRPRSPRARIPFPSPA